MEKLNDFSISGQIVDLKRSKIVRGTIHVAGGKIVSVIEDNNQENVFIMPGFIDSHVHIESSMLVPSEFARLAVVHGTVATVSDPHEIANVLGLEGIDFMIENGKQVPFHFYFGAPSCVPATAFETAGTHLGPEEMEQLMQRDDIHYMAEMMNYPGVIYDDPEVYAKLAIAKKYNKPIDGHAPALRGEQLTKYIDAGISTDHECITKEEALEKIQKGMKIQLREGSAAKNFEGFFDLLDNYPEQIFLCTDDKHPDDLIRGHINLMVKRLVEAGYDPIKVLRSTILNPIAHYNLQVGLLQEGDNADFIVVDNLRSFNVLKTFINGQLVAENGSSKIMPVAINPINRFEAEFISKETIQLAAPAGKVRIIEALDGKLDTNTIIDYPMIKDGMIVSDIERDYLKIMVINRYEKAKPAIALIKNFGLKQGALASTVAHDSHNIIAVGADDESLVKAINLIIESKGGIAAVVGDESNILPLPVAGLMSDKDGFQVAAAYEKLNKMAAQAGSKLGAPFMTLAFMALLVIPQLKLSDKGLFDGAEFKFTELAAE